MSQTPTGDTSLIPIKTGDPKAEPAEPASYTYFVLPFAYALESFRGPRPHRVYTPAEEPSHWRRYYFTVETANVLYQRAKAFAMPRDQYAQTFSFERDSRQIAVQVSAPRLLLFEWPSAKDEREPPRVPDALHLGFLIVETFSQSKTR